MTRFIESELKCWKNDMCICLYFLFAANVCWWLRLWRRTINATINLWAIIVLSKIQEGWAYSCRSHVNSHLHGILSECAISSLLFQKKAKKEKKEAVAAHQNPGLWSASSFFLHVHSLHRIDRYSVICILSVSHVSRHDVERRYAALLDLRGLTWEASQSPAQYR